MMMRELMERVAGILGRQPTMPLDEVEDRLDVLEVKVEANKLALQQHEEQRHKENRGLDQ